MNRQNQNQNQNYLNSKFIKIIQYTLENYFNTKIIDFPNKINQQDKSFYISFNIENHKNEFCIEFKIKEKVDLNTIFDFNKIKLIGEAKIIKYGNSTSCTNNKVGEEKINIYNYLCSKNANKLFLIYNYIKFEANELYIWTEKYGWRNKSMCCGMIKPIHLLASNNQHFDNLICRNQKDIKDLLFHITNELLF